MNIFRHRFNKYKWRLIKEAFKGYPFDSCYFFELQAAKLEEMKHYFENAHYIAQEEYDKKIHYIDIAIKLLHIYLDDDKSIYKNGLFNYSFETREFTSNIKVNRKNEKRFTPHPEILKDWDIYSLKAFHLYQKIITEKAWDWCD